jgi:hypothetical protein
LKSVVVRVPLNILIGDQNEALRQML